MRFVHLSNARLFSENKQEQNQVNSFEDRLEAFKRVVSYCRENVVEAMFLTGNVFAQEATQKDLEVMDALLSEVPDTFVFILSGEDDETTESGALATYSWKSNTHVFVGDCICRVFVQRYGLEVTGIGYSSKTWSQVSLPEFISGRKGKYQVLLLPTLKDQGSIDEVRNVSVPFNYVGIGGSQVIAGEAGSLVYAPGDFVPSDFSSQIEHGYFLGDISEGRDKAASVRFVPAVCKEYITLQIALDENSTIEKVSEEVKNTIRKCGEKNLYHITLTGEGAPEFYFQKNALKKLGNIVEIKDASDRESIIDTLQKKYENEAIGRFLSEMRTSESSAARDAALEYGVSALLEAQKEASSC